MNLQKEKPIEEKTPEKEGVQGSDNVVVKVEQPDTSSTEPKETNSVATSEIEKKEEEKEKESESSTADKKEVRASFLFICNFIINSFQLYRKK